MERKTVTKRHVMDWLDRMADWCENQEMTYEVVRCPEDGWGINITWRDSYGPYYALIHPPAVRDKEPMEGYLDRGIHEARTEIAKTHDRRIKRIVGKRPATHAETKNKHRPRQEQSQDHSTSPYILART